MTKAYIVEQVTRDFYYGRITGKDVIGYYFDKTEAERVANAHKEDEYHTVDDATVREIEIH